MKRSAVLVLGLALGCASSATQSKNSAPSATTSPSPHRPEQGAEAASLAREDTVSASAAEPLPVLPFAEARQRADASWLAAERAKTSVLAWEQAGEALALAAQATADDPAAAAPLLKGALAAWSKSETLQPAVSKEAGGTETQRPLPRKETLRIAALVQLAALSDPQSTELAMIGYRHGRVLWNYAHYLEAAEHFSMVVERFPGTQEARHASALLLDTLLRAGALDQLEERANQMLKNKRLLAAHPQLAETLLLVRHQASRREAKQLVEAAQYQACGDAYLALHKRDQHIPSVQGDELLYNASVCWERAKQGKRAATVLRQLVRLYPQSRFAEGAQSRAETLTARP